MRQLLVLLFALYAANAQSQEPHEKPDHPKGNNSNDQYEALPFYNEACELYQAGETERTKRALYEAINTSFALTEAQLFLGTIFFEEGQMDSAFLYLNSGIDFAINQKPHFYFMMMESGLTMELYDVVKHNMKHFKKFYSQLDHGKYEEEYPYTVDDYERYLNAMDLIFDYKNWIPKSTLIDTLFNHHEDVVVTPLKKDLVWSQGNQFKKARASKKFNKSKKMKTELPEGSFSSIRFSNNGKYVFITKNINDSISQIFYAQNQSKITSWKALPENVNVNAWNGDPYFLEDKNLLYFSSDRQGSKDLYVIQFDPEKNIASNLTFLERVNTDGDEINPVFYNNHFYFSSNGRPGFGGFDLYYTENYSITSDILVPSNGFNMGKPYNTGADEVSIQFLENLQHVIHRMTWKGEQSWLLMDFAPQKEPFNYDIKVIDFPEDID